MSCELPSTKSVSIFLDSEEGSKVFVANPTGDDKDKVFIGRLNLQRLGFFNQISRFFGNLSKLYIVIGSVDTPEREGDKNIDRIE